ncbi:MAG: hypothetical protein C5B58_03015 [Acidobacteria bacterium]|nr:MAG: hypothetical protein C5B58_03015 [Acidobacteriota bacterium]
MKAGATVEAGVAAQSRTNWQRRFVRAVFFFDANKMGAPLALRNTLGVVAPLVAGYAFGMPRGGLAMASGALNVSYTDGSDPYSQRAKRMLAWTVFGAAAVLLGGLTGHHNVASVLIVMAWAFGAGMLVSLGTTAADVGVISTVMLVIYAAQALTPRQTIDAAVLAGAGGLLQTGLSIALWPVRRYEPERRTLGSLFFALARAARAPTEALKAPPASLESTQAQDALAGLGRDETVEGVRYRSLLGQAERIRLSVMTLARLRVRLVRESGMQGAVETTGRFLENAAKILESIGESLSTGANLAPQQDRSVLSTALAYQVREDNAGEPGTFAAAVARNVRYQMDALGGQLRAAAELASHATPEGQLAFAREEARQPVWMRFNGRLATLRANLNLRSAVFRHALRLALCIGVGEAVGRGLESPRSYWIPMTIVLVLKPEFTTTFSRGILRIAGTIAGLFVATALFHFLPIHTATEITLIAVFTFLLRWVGPANYGIFAVAISALVVLLLAIAGVSPKEAIEARGVNTVIGGLLALAGYGVWPTWERTRLPDLFATLLEAYRESFYSITEHYLNPGSSTAKQRDRARQAARTARSNLEASLDRLAAEPGTTIEQMNRRNAMLASSHRFAHAMMALEAGLLYTKDAPARPEVHVFRDDVETTLTLLAQALRGARVTDRQFPDLRADHSRLVSAGDPTAERYALVNVEADRMVNALNTLREQALHGDR